MQIKKMAIFFQLMATLSFTSFLLTACQRPAVEPVDDPPVVDIGKDSGVVDSGVVDSGVVDSGVVDSGVIQPPARPDCNALPYEHAGRTENLNCSVLFSDQYICENAYPDGPENPADFSLILACGGCDAKYLNVVPTPQYCGLVVAGEDAGVIDTDAGYIPPVVELDDTSCKGCHAPDGHYDGPNSIENPHPWSTVKCLDCHGGNGESFNPVYAHVCAPPQIGNRQQQINDPRAFFLSYTTAGVQLLPDYTCPTAGGGERTVSPLEWLNFINPGDLRSAKDGIGCGKCHGGTVKYVSRSIMGTGAGLNSGTRHGVGIENAYPERRGKLRSKDWNTMGDYAAMAVPTNPDYSEATREVGEIPSLKQAPVITGGNFKNDTSYTADLINNSLNVNNINADNYPNGMQNGPAAQLFQEVLNQACTGCHLQNAYNNFRAGDYRSTGCTACHYATDTLGRYAGRDPNINRAEPLNPDNLTPGEQSHRRDHLIRNVAKLPGQGGATTVIQGIDDTNCRVCHAGSNRTVMQFAGIRLDQNQDLANNNFYPTENAIVFTHATELFGENATFNGRAVTQWIKTEIWQTDSVDENVGQGQDETPEDIHHESGMGCIDCHSTGAVHGDGKIYSRMKIQTHKNDILCETCHGTIDNYARVIDGKIVDSNDKPLENTYAQGNGEFWMVSKLNGTRKYLTQIKDVVNAANQTKVYPNDGSMRSGPIYNRVASAAMGRYQVSQDLTDGYGPEQPNSNAVQIREGFTHAAPHEDGVPDKGLECYTCHSSWQNSCVGCHLDATYDNNANNFFYSQVTGERIYFNFAANFVYQNPVSFMMGLNDRGKISPFQGMHRFFSYTDINGDTSNRISPSDRNGLGNDPALRNNQRNNQPALQNQPYTPHSIRGRYTYDKKGSRGCLSCHNYDANNVVLHDQVDDWVDFQNVLNNEQDYVNALPFNTQMALGLGSDLWLFDEDGESIFDTNNNAVYNLDRIVEANGTSNSSSNHPMLNPNDINLDYEDFGSTNGAKVARPLPHNVLQRLSNLQLTDVYYYNAVPGTDPADSKIYTLFLDDYNYVGQDD